MKLKDIYHRAIETGMAFDPRGEASVRKILAEEEARLAKLPPEEASNFDRDRLFNPYADTRILHGRPDMEIKSVLAGIDIEVPEVLLAFLAKKNLNKKIDLIIAHHPEGYALAGLYDVMKLQTDQLAAWGVNVSVAEKLMEKRISEVERRLLAVNHNRTVDAVRLLDMPMLCIHTPADNCVTHYLQKLFEQEKPFTLGAAVKLLKQIPEYQKSAALFGTPKIISGSESSRCGKIYVDMTGGTEGSKEIFEQQAAAGISTLVCMHLSEDALEKVKKANLNVIIAGHIASDVFGLNLLFDQMEKEETFDFLCVSGFERLRQADRQRLTMSVD